MSYAQWLGEFGGTAQPLVMKEFFEQVLYYRGHPVKLLHGPSKINCPCVNNIYNEPDPDCKVCKGTGNTTAWQEERSFMAIVFFTPAYSQDKHQRFEMRAGPIEGYDGRMYCESRWYNQIHIGDVIIYKEPNTAQGIELMIVSKLPRQGNNGEIIYVRCDVEKQPSRKVLDATDIRNQL